MTYTKDDLREIFYNVTQDVENSNGFLGAMEIRRLSENGIPIISIMAKNIPFACLKYGFEKWLKSL